jgi:hypothetical protein
VQGYLHWRMPARNYLGGRGRAMMHASSEGEDEGGGAAWIDGGRCARAIAM